MRLRLPEEADAGWIADAVSDPEVPRWTRVPSPYTKDDAFAWIALAGRMSRERSAYHLLIVGPPDLARLGSIGLELHEEPSLHGEIGYWVAANARGRQVATRAVRLLAAWALDTVGVPVVELHVLPANERSQAVARKAGFTLAGRRLLPFRGRVEDFEIYATGQARGGP